MSKDRELWWMPTDFFTRHKDDSHLEHKSDNIQYKFNGYVCPKCSLVFQRTPDGDEILRDFPKYGKQKELCKDCA